MTNVTTQQLDKKLDDLQTQLENVQLEWSEFNRMTQIEKVQSEKKYLDFVNELSVIRARVDRTEIERHSAKINSTPCT